MTTELTTIEEQLFVGGRWIDGAAEQRFDVEDPATGERIGSVPNAEPCDVASAIEAATAALRPWRQTPARERGRILSRSAEIVRERLEDIACTMTREQGKPLAEARGEVEVSASFLEWFAGEGERVYGEVIPPQQAHQRALALRQPVGVTAAITPWNFPAAMMARKLGPALAAGCSMIVKPASATPLTAAAILRCLQDGGVPDGVVNLITSRDSAGVAQQIFEDGRVAKVSFTGSTEVGKVLIRLSAAHVTRLSLELGGHSPYLVFEDADLDLAAKQLVISKFRNSGQTCVCANRAFIQATVYEEVVERVASITKELVIGHGLDPGTTLGPLINSGAVASVAAQVEDAVGGGARLITGGARPDGDGLDRGSFFEPTILADAAPEMLISREETFGPALAMASFETEQEAVTLANNSPYGLAAYLHTRDYGRLLRVAEALEYGIVGVDSGVITAANSPFGGMKESGYGTEGGSTGINEYLSTKYVLLGDVG